MNAQDKRILSINAGTLTAGAMAVWVFTDAPWFSVIGGTIAGIMSVAMLQRRRSQERDAERHTERMEFRELGDFYEGPGGLSVDLYKMRDGRPVSREIFTTEDGLEWATWPSDMLVVDDGWLRTHYKFWIGSGGKMGQPLVPTPARVDQAMPDIGTDDTGNANVSTWDDGFKKKHS